MREKKIILRSLLEGEEVGTNRTVAYDFKHFLVQEITFNSYWHGTNPLVNNKIGNHPRSWSGGECAHVSSPYRLVEGERAGGSGKIPDPGKL